MGLSCPLSSLHKLHRDASQLLCIVRSLHTPTNSEIVYLIFFQKSSRVRNCSTPDYSTSQFTQLASTKPTHENELKHKYSSSLSLALVLSMVWLVKHAECVPSLSSNTSLLVAIPVTTNNTLLIVFAPVLDTCPYSFALFASLHSSNSMLGLKMTSSSVIKGGGEDMESVFYACLFFFLITFLNLKDRSTFFALNQVAAQLSNTCTWLHKHQHEHQTRAQAQFMAFASSNRLHSGPTSTTIQSLQDYASMQLDSSLFPPTNSTFSLFLASFTWCTLPRHRL